eukprot:CAMPEP_0177758858 /NCGR_PEP_ID=MMETSP0491_2-20121128/4415_1 /TAXON_ID=63592 /ORGANISM="Tetraselmis chuii, Strain PLY429" /LENGTH=271 /DNA_ID=CAMNT_0019274633 /DNA_START=103 /DNA_END=918 /DNA_ORIENTATION=+
MTLLRNGDDEERRVSPPEGAFTLIAHRGGCAIRPEGTVEAFDCALAGGFPHVETDCQLTSDGVCLLLHDETLDRTTSGSGAVADTNATTLLQLDAGSWFAPEYSGARVPLLSEFLRRYDGRCHLHLELKSEQEGLAAEVARVIRECGWDRYSSGDTWGVPGLTITSFHLEQLQRFEMEMPGLRLGWLVHDLTDDVMDLCRESSISGIYPRANICSREAIQKAIASGFAVRGWGVKNLELLYDLVLAGAHGCTVDWPEEARSAFQHGFSGQS